MKSLNLGNLSRNLGKAKGGLQSKQTGKQTKRAKRQGAKTAFEAKRDDDLKSLLPKPLI